LNPEQTKMQGDPEQFEAIGNRLGFEVAEETPSALKLVWKGPRFPAFLCLGISLALLVISVPIVQAIQLRGFSGAAGSLWYFPLMNAILFGIAIFLLVQQRTIIIDAQRRQVTLRRRSLFSAQQLTLSFDEIARIALGTDQVESGFGLAGSTAAQKFPVPSLRICTKANASILIDRASKRRLQVLAERIRAILGRDVSVEAM
jgi:hypothetical protein